MKIKLILIAILVAACAIASAQLGKPATLFKVGETLAFTMDKGESKDLSITLPKGAYYMQADLRLADGEPTNIQMEIDLLKTNGAMIKSTILSANDIHVVSRVAKTFRIEAAGAFRLRVKNGGKAMEYWLRIFPDAQRKFVPFPTGNEELKALGIGADQGKGGVFGKRGGEDPWWAYHKITLQPGKYTMSVYLSHIEDNFKSNLQASMIILDPFGVQTSDWNLHVNEIDHEARIEKKLVVVKATTYIFKVSNDGGYPVNYIVGIEKN